MALLRGSELITEIGRAQELFSLPLKAPNIYTTNAEASLEDIGSVVLLNSGSAISFTIQRASSMTRPLPLFQTLVVGQLGAGAASIVGGTGVSINGVSAGTVTFSAIGEIACLWQYAADSWLAFNKTAA